MNNPVPILVFADVLQYPGNLFFQELSAKIIHFYYLHSVGGSCTQVDIDQIAGLKTASDHPNGANKSC